MQAFNREQEKKTRATSWKQWRQVWLSVEGRVLCCRQQDCRDNTVIFLCVLFTGCLKWWRELLNNPVIIKRHGSEEGIRGDHDVTVSIGDWYAGSTNGNPHHWSVPILLLTCITCPWRCCDSRKVGKASWFPTVYFRLRLNPRLRKVFVRKCSLTL